MILGDCAVLIILLPLVVNIFKIESMDVARDVSQQCEQNVDAKVNTAPGNQENAERRNEDLVCQRREPTSEHTVMITTRRAEAPAIWLV